MSLTHVNLILALGWLSLASGAVIKNNGYKGVTVGFAESVDLEAIDFGKLKAILSNASEILYHATRRRSYFEEFVLVLPLSWEDSSMCEEQVVDALQKIDIHISDSPDIPQLRAINSNGCGLEGDIMHMNTGWLNGNVEKLAAHFVQQWSTFRYGVFSEDPETTGSCTVVGNKMSPTGCYNVESNVDPDFDDNGLPLCYFPEDFSLKDDLRSSIMFQANSSQVIDFCDGTATFPHNPVAPTLHNRVCRGQTVWSVIRNGEDFRYGRNLPRKEDRPPKRPVFRCFRVSKTQVTIALQSSAAKVLSTELTEIRYALLHFLATMGSTDSAANLITFADVADEVVALDPSDKDELSSVLDTRIRQTKQVGDICMVCGLTQAYEVAKVNSGEYSSQVVLLFIWESSLQNTRQTDLVELIQSYPKITLFLLLVEDVDGDIVSWSLRDAVDSTRGQIVRLKPDLIFMVSGLNIGLIEAFETNLRIENKALLVHQKVYENVTTGITDVFSTPNTPKGKLLYTMHCPTPGLIRNVNKSCTVWDTESQTYKCGKETDLVDNKNSKTEWKYYYERVDNIRPVKCVSLAWLKMESRSSGFMTLRGWMNKREIKPVEDALIIYAEVERKKDWDVQVEARISGPDMKDFRLELRDNGNGDPDIVKDDGVFSRYFTGFPEKGNYEVMIAARYTESRISAKAIDKSEDENTLSQIKAINTFRVTAPPPEEDVYPPNRVADLKVHSIDHENSTVLLQWTAPGNDYDYGAANQYVFKLSRLWMTLNDFTFNVEENIILTPLENLSPADSGIPEKASFQCPQNNQNITYYVALVATDGNDNTGKLSNIVQVHFRTSSIDKTTKSSEYTSPTTASSVSSSIEDANETSPSHTSSPKIDNITATPNDTEDKEGLFIEKDLAIIAFSVAGVIFLLLIICVIVLCCCWCKAKQKSDKLKTSQRRKSPYNLNVAYKNGSESSLDADNPLSHSMSTLAEPNNSDSKEPNRSQIGPRYSYHTEQSLLNSQKSNNAKNELGFRVVESMPAYATSSLSRFEKRNSNMESPSLKPQRSNVRESTPKEDAFVYNLGDV